MARKNNRGAGHYKKRTNGVCPYSESCFDCPLTDCRVGSSTAWKYNTLEYDEERARSVRGGARFRKEKYNNGRY